MTEWWRPGETVYWVDDPAYLTPENNPRVRSEMTAPSRPVLRYHGGKSRLASWVVSLLGEHRTYVEPYCGAASVLMQKPRSPGEVINDMSRQVVDLFEVLRDPELARQLKHAAELTPFAREEYETLKMRNTSEDRVERARALIFLSFASYGCLQTARVGEAGNGFRSKRSGGGQLPSGEWRSWPEQIASFTARLRGVVIECRPALQVITQYDSADTLFYLDPPYLPETRSSHRCVYNHEMSAGDHEELLTALQSVAAGVAISGYRSELYEDVLGDWDLTTTVARVVSGAAREECVWRNDRAIEQHAQLRLEVCA